MFRDLRKHVSLEGPTGGEAGRAREATQRVSSLLTAHPRGGHGDSPSGVAPPLPRTRARLP